jgi:phage terminase large subunit-like protein
LTPLGADAAAANQPDVSETKDLTALVLIGSDIRDRHGPSGRRSGSQAKGSMTGPAATASPTSPWHTQGHLETTPSSSISYEHVAQHPRTVFDRQHVIKLAFDR